MDEICFVHTENFYNNLQWFHSASHLLLHVHLNVQHVEVGVLTFFKTKHTMHGRLHSRIKVRKNKNSN